MGRASNDRFLGRMDGRVGVGHAGADESDCTVNLALARRATMAGASIVATLATPSALHVPFLVCTPAGDLVRPATVLVNQTGLITPEMTAYTRGPVQFGVAEAVFGAPLIKQLSSFLINEMLFLVALHLPIELARTTPSWPVEERLRTSARMATRQALEHAMEGLPFGAVVPVYPPAPLVRGVRSSSR